MLLKAKNLGKAVIGQLGNCPILPPPTPADDRTSLERPNCIGSTCRTSITAKSRGKDF